MDEYKKSNREKRLSPKSKGAHWCDTCDAQLVYVGNRCRNCGAPSGKTIKKETNAR